jgi:hypothetical protein
VCRGRSSRCASQIQYFVRMNLHLRYDSGCIHHFWVLCFPHEGQIITIDQLSFSHTDPSSGASMVSMIENPQPGIVNLGVGLFPPLMGIFNYPPPSNYVKFILVVLN